MRLDGSLEDFGLPDILQLLAGTAKTGALHLSATDAERRGVIRLAAGAVDGASSDLRRQPLARRLIGAGLVSDEALDGAAADVRAGAPSFLRALLDRAGLDPEEVRRVAADQATDAVCELLRWSAGTFSFLVGEADPDELGLGLPSSDLVAEGRRRMEVWPSLTSHIPSPDTVLRLSAAPSFDPTCTREEWGLLALIDGNRSVSEIVALLGRSEFAVAGALAALVERGLLTVSAAGSGLVDLQRRQAVVAGFEDLPAVAPDAPASAPEPSPAPDPEAPVAPAAEVPQARSAEAVAEHPPAAAPEHDVTTATAPDPSIGSQAPEAPAGRIFDQPVVSGTAALDPAHHLAAAPMTDPAVQPGAHVDPEPALQPGQTVRGLDSAVTKSLVLRLIAGVRGL